MAGLAIMIYTARWDGVGCGFYYCEGSWIGTDWGNWNDLDFMWIDIHWVFYIHTYVGFYVRGGRLSDSLSVS